MVSPFVGEIRMFAGTFAPKGWAFCDGSLIHVRDNEELFSVLGSVYGGDGRTTFGLPDLRGRLPMHAGTGLGLTPRSIGAKGGAETVTLKSDEVPGHSHDLLASSDLASTMLPTGAVPARAVSQLWSEDYDPDLMATAGLLADGNSSPSPFSNLMPFAVINFIIALTGLIPTET